MEDVIYNILMFALVAIVGYVSKTYLIPYLQDKHLEDAATIAVHAAEALYESGHGAEKLAYATQLLNEKFGLKLDADKIRTAIEAAWKAMDINQVAAGEKTEAEETETEATETVEQTEIAE